MESNAGRLAREFSKLLEAEKLDSDIQREAIKTYAVIEMTTALWKTADALAAIVDILQEHKEEGKEDE